jgi:hypothetical protein
VKARIKITGCKAKTPKDKRPPDQLILVEDRNHTFINARMKDVTPTALAAQLRELADIVEQCGLRH